MKTTHKEVWDQFRNLLDAVELVEISLRNAKRLLQREDLPEPWERFDKAADAACAAEADLDANGNCGTRIDLVLKALENLGEELRND